MAGGVHGRGHVWLGVCMAGGVHGRGGAWQGGMCGRGAYVTDGGVHGRGAHMAGGMHGWGYMAGEHVWWGVHGGGMCDRGACVAGGVHGRGCSCHACPPDTMRYGQSLHGQYASYWNAFL